MNDTEHDIYNNVVFVYIISYMSVIKKKNYIGLTKKIVLYIYAQFARTYCAQVRLAYTQRIEAYILIVYKSGVCIYQTNIQHHVLQQTAQIYHACVLYQR